jgi:hypothetical protein
MNISPLEEGSPLLLTKQKHHPFNEQYANFNATITTITIMYPRIREQIQNDCSKKYCPFFTSSFLCREMVSAGEQRA